MNIQLTARKFETAAEMRAAAASTRKKLMGDPRKAAIEAEENERLTKPKMAWVRTDDLKGNTGFGIPLWARQEIHFDEHVFSWRIATSRLIQPVKAYIMNRARQLGFSYAEIVGHGRLKGIANARHLIIWEIKTDFRPGITLPELGRHFNRDHTTILNSIRRIQKMKDEGTLANPLAGEG